MAMRVNLRKNSDIEIRAERHQFIQLILRVEFSPMPRRPEELFLHQLRELLHFKARARIIRQVQVQEVDLVVGNKDIPRMGPFIFFSRRGRGGLQASKL